MTALSSHLVHLEHFKRPKCWHVYVAGKTASSTISKVAAPSQATLNWAINRTPIHGCRWMTRWENANNRIYAQSKLGPWQISLSIKGQNTVALPIIDQNTAVVGINHKVCLLQVIRPMENLWLIVLVWSVLWSLESLCRWVQLVKCLWLTVYRLSASLWNFKLLG